MQATAAASRSGKILAPLIGLAVLLTAGVLGVTFYLSSSTIHELLSENQKLNKAIRNLTDEAQIGYATVKEQGLNERGQLETLVRFVQTAAENPREIVSENLYRMPGDIIHFDALIVKFPEQYVKEGKGRALFLWRRIYGENTAPSAGELIEIPGSAPERYYSISKSLRLKDRDVFWEAIWALANDPNHLSQHGIQAVFGNAIYTRMTPGKLYRFKVSPSGQIYPEVVDVL